MFSVLVIDPTVKPEFMVLANTYALLMVPHYRVKVPEISLILITELVDIKKPATSPLDETTRSNVIDDNVRPLVISYNIPAVF